MTSFLDHRLSLTFHLLNGNMVDDMWESRTEDPLGRISMRKWLRVATGLLVAVFAHLLISATPVHAVPTTTQTPSQTTQQTLSPITLPQTTLAVTASPGDDASSCKVDGVGWIVCSMSRWIADGVDYLYSILTNFFIFTPLATSGETNSMYGLWSTVRNIANVAFIIAFLVIIYAQITGGFLMSNYTIKRLLPRVIVAAILVNTSYWICAVAIDISNILGVAVQEMFTSFRDSIGAANHDFPTWQDVTTSILGGAGIVLGTGAVIAATGGTIGGLAFLLLGALLPAIFAALVAVAVLAARQALITLFVIIAPLAFVAYLLPNTEEWFNRWRKLFTTMLVMFPAFSFIFGASQVAGIIVIQNAKDISVALLGLTIQVVPLFITPFLIKLSSGLLGTIAGLANNRSKGLFDRTGNWAKANREMHRQRGFSKKPAKLDSRGRVRGIRPTTLAQRINNRTLRREGLTEAHRAKAAAQFAESRGGRQVYGRRKDAELRQHAADNINQEAWTRSVYGTPGVAGSGSTHRRSLHHQAHMAAGRAKLIEDGAIAHAERDLQESIIASNGLRQVKLKTELDNQAVKRSEEQWNTMLANIQAAGGAAPNLRAGEVKLANSIRQLTEDVVIEGYAKSQAEALRQETLTKTLLENTRIIEGKTIREYAGGIRGKEGADTVLATAVAQDRKQWGEKSGEKLELIKHFNLSSTQRQDLAMGNNVTTTKDGVTYTFEAIDQYARDAAIDEQLSTGSFSQIKEIIDAAAQGGDTYGWRTTIASGIAKKGLDNKAFFWGAKSIDDVSQGLYSEAQAIKEHLLGDKVKAEKLAVQDVYSLRMAFEAAANPAVTGLLTTDEERTKFADNYEAMRQSADLILRTPELSKSLNHEARDILEQYRA